MTDIVYYVACSLDGYIATPDGGVAWLDAFESADEDYGYGEFLASVDAILIGRTTYEQVLTFGPWPYAGKRTWVFSHGDDSDLPPGAQVTTDDPRVVATALADEGVTRAWLVGGGALAASFQAARLISEYIVSIMPVVLGDGVPLFAPSTSAPTPLLLAETQTYANGVLQARYLRAGDAEDA